MQYPIPEGFKMMMEGLLKEEATDFLTAMEQPPIVSVRINRRKPGAHFPEGKSVKWCKSGLYLPSRPSFILDPLLHAGAYYVQDASSMIFEHLAEIVSKELGGNKIKVLDLCAAPGGKTTALINGLPDGCSIVANEISPKRVVALKENIAKWGYDVVKVTNKDSSSFVVEGEKYDLIIVDAPCSGEGMMRKDEDARRQWSLGLIDQCASLQKEILKNAERILKPGGFLIYSTCAFNRKENEENAIFIKEKLNLEPYNPKLPVEWGIRGGIDSDLPVYRFMPHKTEGEGLFFAMFRKIKKEGEVLGNSLKNRKDKIKISQDHWNKKQINLSSKELPDIEEILKISFDKTKYPSIELSKEQAISYLRRESLIPDEKDPKGIVILTYQGLPLGPGKNIGSRINNLYPKNWRIIMR